ncbi:MAG TPA: extracellular solute-binding protein, partial [Clostridia bacterium]|nr:extracellular solute-binding protein [Clostridia bacterium]
MKMKKIIVLIIAAMVLTTTGCTSGGKKPVESSTPVTSNMNATGYPVLKEMKTYKIVVTKDPNSQNSFNDKQCVKDAEKLTNIHINWMDIPSAAWNEQVNIMIAAGNLPDAFCGTNVDVMQNIDMFVPLDDYISKYAPNVVEMFKGDPV